MAAPMLIGTAAATSGLAPAQFAAGLESEILRDEAIDEH
jgi:hypothetical protein